MSARIRGRLIAVLAAAAVLGVFVLANLHLVSVAFESQPDCVPHLKAPGPQGQFRAAKSSC